MRTLAKILRTIGGGLTWPTGQYAATRAPRAVAQLLLPLPEQVR